MHYRIGVDVGGTFTDFLLVGEEGEPRVFKVPTVPEDLAGGVLGGLQEMARETGNSLAEFLGQVRLIVHGTTTTTNAVLNGRGVRTGLLTTAGFRDILEMRRGTREEQYNNKAAPPPPLVPAWLRQPVHERVDAQGELVRATLAGDIEAAIATFRAEGVEAVAICFMHAYANPTNEIAAQDMVADLAPDLYLTVSHELLSQVRLYDRVSTAVLNSYVGPILARYLHDLSARLQAEGFTGTLLIMQSNGGVTSPEVASRQAATTLLSGPAAGPVAGTAYVDPLGFGDCITVDMGGTSFDAALVRDRTPLVVTDGSIDHYLLALPMMGIHTIGAGGGSLGWIDGGGLLRMGPQSAGASPGPACYGRGGERPTCTDADLVLGYLNPDYFLGGRIPLHRERAERAIAEHVAAPLSMSVTQAAAGMYRIINVNMAAGVEEVSVKRGLDPRDFPLVVAGGAGPVHAGMIAGELGIPLIVVPRQSSIFCAAGMLLSDLKHDYVRTHYQPIVDIDPAQFSTLIAEVAEAGRATLAGEGIPPERMVISYSGDLRYIGQYHEVNVPLPADVAEGADLSDIARRFHDEHNRLYGYCVPEAPVEVLNVRAVAVGRTEKFRFPHQERASAPEPHLKGHRPVFLPENGEFADVPVFDGDTMGFGHQVEGPAIVEQATTTIVVPSGFALACDRRANFLMYAKARRHEFEERLLA